MAMTKIWEVREISLRDLGIAIMLDSGTLTPVVKKLAQKGLVTRTRSVVDERVLLVKLTAKGKKLYEIAKEIPQKMAAEWAGEWLI
jgi:DNA-binding MarR family transcriptional regulator